MLIKKDHSSGNASRRLRGGDFDDNSFLQLVQDNKEPMENIDLGIEVYFTRYLIGAVGWSPVAFYPKEYGDKR